jgi:hypothetical protein
MPKTIKEEVEVEGVDIQVIEDREKFKNYTEVPRSIPEDDVLIRFEVPREKTIELMSKISQVLNPTET